METYFDSHLDLLQRQIQKHSDRLKMKAEVALKKRAHSGDILTENIDREIKNFKLKVCCALPRTLGTNPLTSLDRYPHGCSPLLPRGNPPKLSGHAIKSRFSSV